jgi:predicted Zn finger-like uncharacterized protein
MILACPTCSANLRVDDAHRGRQVLCPTCNQAVTVPATPPAAYGPPRPPNPLTPSLPPPPPPAPPAPPRHAPQPGAYPSGWDDSRPPSGWDDRRPRWSRPSERPLGMAIAGMVLGIVALALVCLWPISLVCSIVGLILSALAIKPSGGHGMAYAGLACSIAALVLVLGFILFAVVMVTTHPSPYYYR